MFIEKFNFSSSKAHNCVLIRRYRGSEIIMAIYVDGLLVTSDFDSANHVIEFLRNEFEIKIFSENCFLGLELKRYGSLFVHQTTYAQKLLSKFNIMDCKTVTTPADQNNIADAYETSEKSENFSYRELIGSLMYLVTGTRPDIAFAVGVASRFMESNSSSC